MSEFFNILAVTWFVALFIGATIGSLAGWWAGPLADRIAPVDRTTRKHDDNVRELGSVR